MGGWMPEGEEDMDIFALLRLVLGLAFFLFGMNVMSSNLEKMAGGKLEHSDLEAGDGAAGGVEHDDEAGGELAELEAGGGGHPTRPRVLRSVAVAMATPPRSST